MRFEITILGCNSATPTPNRHPSAQVLNAHEQLYLIDCGEGTQLRMAVCGVRRSKIEQIFISHLHGDHVFGLIGLLTSYSLGGRTNALDIFSPHGLEEMINVQLHHTGGKLSFAVHFHVVETTQFQKIFEDTRIEVFSLPLVHRIPTNGFLFREKPLEKNIIPSKIEEYQIPFLDIKAIKQGENFVTKNGKIILNSVLTLPEATPRSYAYCSDTAFHEPLIEQIKGVSLLYHETTFCDDNEAQASLSMHSTAREAATIALRADVGQLITGHYSARYKDISQFAAEAKTIFENTILGEEGKTYPVTNG